MADVCFYEAFSEEREALQRLLPAAIRAVYCATTIQESGDVEPAAPLISIRTQSLLPAAWMAGLDGLLTRSTGYDHVLAFRQRAPDAGLRCGYLPNYCARAVAEQAILFVLALLRKLPRQQAQWPRFHRDGLTGGELQGRHLAVFGVGTIGIEVVRLGQALGMRVVGVDPVRRHEEVRYVEEDDALTHAEVLVVAMNLTETNRGYFNEARLARCRHGALLVNIGRGECTPARPLASLLQAGQLGGVALDVFGGESEIAADLRRGGAGSGPEAEALMELRGRDNVIFTPHNAFNTHEALERKTAQSVEEVRRFLDEGRFTWPVPPV